MMFHQNIMVSWVPYSSPSLSTRGRGLPAGAFLLSAANDLKFKSARNREDEDCNNSGFSKIPQNSLNDDVAG
jgi:hypothetical protein